MLSTTPAVDARERRWTDSAARPGLLIPAQRRAPSSEPVVEARRNWRRNVFEHLPFDPQCARILLCGLLLFGALVSQMTPQPAQPADPGQQASQHGSATSTRR